MDIQNVRFLSQTLKLASPSAADVVAAFGSLSARGTLEITCKPEEIATLLLAAERASFFGLRLERGEVLRITAHKGKEGRCYDTGRLAQYRGSAAATMDDDHHLLLGKVRVCEKTARLYSSEAYLGRIEVTPPDPGLLERLDKDPAPFDCDTFEADAKALAARVPAAGASSADRITVFYPGPFRLLILADGSLVQRGRLLRIPIPQARELERMDGAILDPAWLPGAAVDPPNYRTEYERHGAACLLEDLPLEAGPYRPRKTELGALDEIPESMKRRLLALVSRGDEHFILTGSDPAQQDGCCPSNEVGVANRLADAGVLDSLCAAPNTECPVTLYAFSGEIRKQGGKPAFVRNEVLRVAVKDRLEHGPGLSRKLVVRIAFVALLAAAMVTLAMAIYRQLRGR
jgi:hypothetical protein